MLWYYGGRKDGPYPTLFRELFQVVCQWSFGSAIRYPYIMARIMARISAGKWGFVWTLSIYATSASPIVV
jgi:hypothetical protein